MKVRAAVFSDNRLNDLIRAANSISSRMAGVLKFDITPEELCEAFIKPEDIPILIRAKEILKAHPWQTNQMSFTLRNYDGHDCNVSFTLKGNINYLIPKYAMDGSTTPKFSDDAWLKVHTYTMSLAKIIERRQLCIDIINHLNFACRDVAQFKVAFPFLLQLAQHADDQRIVETIQKAKTPRQFAALTTRARAAASESTLFLNKALLISTRCEQNPDVDVSITFPRTSHDFA
jgi:hypothetical protein